MKQNAGEYILLLLAAWSVSTVGFNAFFLDAFVENGGYALRSGLALAVVAVLLLALYAAAYSRKRLLIGVIGYIILLGVLVAIALAVSDGGSFYSGDGPIIANNTVVQSGDWVPNLYLDVEGNYLYFVVVMIFACTGGFLLTRSLAGSAIYFLGCAFCCTLVQAFYQSDEVVFSVAAALASLALIVHRNFKLGLQTADAARKPSLGSSFVSSVSPVGASCALALLVWFAILAPLNPSVLQITLRTDYRTLPIDIEKGTADQQPNFTYDYTTDQLTKGFVYTTDDLYEQPDAEVTIDARSVLEQEKQQQLKQSAAAGSGMRDSLDAESPNQQFNAISWSVIFPFIVIIIALLILGIAAIVVYFLARRRWRTLRLVNMLNLPPREQVKAMYRFELNRLAKLGFKVPVGMTLAEYTAGSARAMDMLTETTRVHFDQLTTTYTACVYGQHEPTEDEIVPFVAYYQQFWRAARTHLGNLRYFFKAFKL